ncbi:lysine-rich nucleolar protein 1 isoform X2 [Salmo salar]|uniref:Lysine-rich nucleolar protein 1 isoform X2 n=1 Tax=Salmo salar TaxID=8030 RepID=A0A1S3L4G6_SALSA|nr:lysine-rich nucleolar protein 1 isoform X2 [Salmo salar]
MVVKKKKGETRESGEAEKEMVVKKKKGETRESGEAEKEMVVKKKKGETRESGEAEKEMVVKKKKGETRESGEAEKEMVVKKKKGAEATVAVQEEEQNNTKKKKPKFSSSAADTTMETEGKEGKMKKEKRKASALTEKEDVMVVDKRKPKHMKRVDTKGVVEQAEDGESKGRKKVKKSSSEVETEMEDSTPHKKGKKIMTKGKKKIKVESCTPEDQERDQTDVVFLSETRGNAFEINIDQGRRLALQNEIDQKSNPVQLKPGLGQWGTAQFDSSDQHNKFLRLMGGFKKGGQPMAASGATGGRANMALTKDGQQSLQQGLLGEFERAQSRRMDFTGKGAGLGFSAPSNKKFSIDINTTRSVRFDD